MKQRLRFTTMLDWPRGETRAGRLAAITSAAPSTTYRLVYAGCPIVGSWPVFDFEVDADEIREIAKILNEPVSFLEARKV